MNLIENLPEIPGPGSLHRTSRSCPVGRHPALSKVRQPAYRPEGGWGPGGTVGPGGIGGKAIIRFLKRHMDPKGSLLITDQYPAYNTIAGWTSHTVINHSVAHVQGKVHTNTIEGSGSLLKRAWFGSFHHYAVKYIPLYAAEATWKYNHRKDRNAFATFLRGAMV